MRAIFSPTTTMCLFTNWSWVKCELRFHLEGAVEYIAGGKVVVAHSRVGYFVCLALRLKHVCLSPKTLSDNFLTFPLNNSIADCDSQSLRMKPPFLPLSLLFPRSIFILLLKNSVMGKQLSNPISMLILD